MSLNDALKDAGDNWLMIGDESWNKVTRREHMQLNSVHDKKHFLHSSPANPANLANSGVEILPLRRTLKQMELFPIHALGNILEEAANDIISIIQAPPAIVCQSLLAGASLTVQAIANIKIDGRIKPLSEYFITIADSGERKSAIDDVIMSPHKEYQKNLMQKYEDESSAYDVQLKRYNHKEMKAIKSTNDQDINNLEEKPQAPMYPVMFPEEPTFEGLSKLLAVGIPSAGLFSDEGGRMIGGYGMNQENRLKTISGLSKLWDGSPLDRVRAGDGASILYGRRLSLHLMMQSGVAMKFLGDPVARDQGILGRTLTVFPDSTCGSRPYVEENVYLQMGVKTYHEQVKKIIERWRFKDNNEGLELREIEFSPAAKRRWVEFHDYIESQLNEEQLYHPIKPFAAKAPEHCYRIAAILEIFNNPDACIVGIKQIDGAIELTDYYLSESLRLHTASSDNPNLVLCEKTLDWIKEEGFKEIYPSKIYQFGHGDIRCKKKADEVLEILIEHGYLYRLSDDEVKAYPAIDGKKRRTIYRVLSTNYSNEIPHANELLQ